MTLATPPRQKGGNVLGIKEQGDHFVKDEKGLENLVAKPEARTQGKEQAPDSVNLLQEQSNQSWWFLSAVPELRRWKLRDYRFEASLRHILNG